MQDILRGHLMKLRRLLTELSQFLTELSGLLTELSGLLTELSQLLTERGRLLTGSPMLQLPKCAYRECYILQKVLNYVINRVVSVAYIINNAYLCSR